MVVPAESVLCLAEPTGLAPKGSAEGSDNLPHASGELSK